MLRTRIKRSQPTILFIYHHQNILEGLVEAIESREDARDCEGARDFIESRSLGGLPSGRPMSLLLWRLWQARGIHSCRCSNEPTPSLSALNSHQDAHFPQFAVLDSPQPATLILNLARLEPFYLQNLTVSFKQSLCSHPLLTVVTRL